MRRTHTRAHTCMHARTRARARRTYPTYLKLIEKIYKSMKNP